MVSLQLRGDEDYEDDDDGDDDDDEEDKDDEEDEYDEDDEDDECVQHPEYISKINFRFCFSYLIVCHIFEEHFI